MEEIKPIKPEEVTGKHVPNYVIDAFNYFIDEKWDGTKSEVFFEDVLRKISRDDADIRRSGFDQRPTRKQVESCGWLDDVIPIYTNVGWKIVIHDNMFKGKYYTFTKQNMKIS